MIAIMICKELLKGENDNFEEFDCVKMNDQDLQHFYIDFRESCE